MSGLKRFTPAVGVLVGYLVAGAPVEGQTYKDPAKAKKTFAFRTQGDYRGEVGRDDGTTTVGIQVIARGDGKFRGTVYEHGLPGDSEKVARQGTAKGERRGDRVVFEDTPLAQKLVIEDGALKVHDADGGVVGKLKKLHRKSPTLGKEPPEGATVLFDGTSADAFKGGEMTEDGLLKQGVTSKKKFRDHVVHVEFRLPFEPADRGQGRGNSGMYLLHEYEVQMLDSFGLKGKHNQCGGLYDYRAPDVNMCYPPLTWQTYDVRFTAARYYADGNKVRNARITVRHNGVVIHDDVELKSPDSYPHKVERGPLHLQDHNNPVRYRNIWVVEK